MKIILGSQSKGRRGVLESMGYQFKVMSSNIDEKSIRCDNPKQLTLTLANAKADALLEKIHEPSLLITSDQVVVWDGKIREKPTNKKEAQEFLHGYSTYPAETVTAVVVVNTKTGKRNEGVDVAKVWFRSIPNDVIDTLVGQGDVYSHAGGFSIEDPVLKNYIKKIEGAADSVIGLPKVLTRQLITEMENN